MENKNVVPEDFFLSKGNENQNPSGITFWELIKEDYRTYDRTFIDPGFWAVTLHRFGNWRMDIKSKLFRAPMTLLYNIFFTFIRLFLGIHLCYTTKLGRRVRIWHHGSIYLVSISIGNDVQIRHNTTMGVKKISEKEFKPIIEDHVDIGCGACLLGGIRIGHHSVIGANAVVTKDVPPYSLVGGIPARVIKSLKNNSENDEASYGQEAIGSCHRKE